MDNGRKVREINYLFKIKIDCNKYNIVTVSTRFTLLSFSSYRYYYNNNNNNNKNVAGVHSHHQRYNAAAAAAAAAAAVELLSSGVSASSSGGGTGDTLASCKKRKRRTSFTPHALELLNGHFERNTHPSGNKNYKIILNCTLGVPFNCMFQLLSFSR